MAYGLVDRAGIIPAPLSKVLKWTRIATLAGVVYYEPLRTISIACVLLGPSILRQQKEEYKRRNEEDQRRKSESMRRLDNIEARRGP